MSYDPSTDVGKIRLLIGDKDEHNEVFSNTEIQVFLDLQGSINLAAAEALEAWASQYAANADQESMGDYSYSQRIVDKMMALAKRLREKEAAKPVLEWAEMNLTSIGEILEE